MKVLVSQDHRFSRTPDGAVWTEAAFPRSYFDQFLDVFDGVRVVARIREVTAAPRGALRADGDGVTFHAVPYFMGPQQFALKYFQIRRALRKSLQTAPAAVLRVQSHIASEMESMLHSRGRPYALEVMCDAYEMFSPGCNDHPLRPILRVVLHEQVKRQCKRAPAVSYVTEFALQASYPPGPKAFSTFYSGVEMRPEAYVHEPRFRFNSDRKFRIITVGSLDQPYKGVDALIDAVRLCVSRGCNLELVVVGDGRYRSQLESCAQTLGDRVRFLGHVSSGTGVRNELDNADLFVLYSRTEGLPRAMIEAMARGLPCLGSAVGGIPELLSAPDLVPPERTDKLAIEIERVFKSPQDLMAMSGRNLAKSREYSDAQIRKRRNSFYSNLRELTQEWLNRRSDARFTTPAPRREDCDDRFNASIESRKGKT